MRERRSLLPPIHFRTRYSLLAGVFSPEEICSLAEAYGSPFVGIADLGNLYALPRFLNAAAARGLSPLVGTCVERDGFPLFTAYCLNSAGFERLNGILTRLLAAAPLRGAGDTAPGGPIVGGGAWSTAPNKPGAAPLRGAAVRAGSSAATRFRQEPPYDPVLDLLANGWEGLSLLLFSPRLMELLAARERRGLHCALPWGRPFREQLAAARRLGIPPVAVNTVAYRTEEERRLLMLLRSIDRIIPIDRLPANEIPHPSLRFAPQETLGSFYSAIPDAIANAAAFAESAAFRPFCGTCVFPSFRGNSEEESFRILQRLCMAGIERRYGAGRAGAVTDGPGAGGAAPGGAIEGGGAGGAAPGGAIEGGGAGGAAPGGAIEGGGAGGAAPGPDGFRRAVLDRLSRELSVIRAKGFAGYFLVVHDIVSRCPRTCGRGSSASSIVSYLLGITHVDPLAQDLFFERFLNMGRVDPPDIDIDFPWDERRKALDYVFSVYPGSAGMVADHVTFGPRSAVREPAKAMGYQEEETAEFVRLFRYGRFEEIPPAVVAAARELRGFPRYIGTHPGGVVIVPGPITRYTHVQRSPLGLPVIAWEKEGTEDAGLVKIDLLGNRSLGVLRDAMALVNPQIVSESPRWDTKVVPARRPLDWESFCPLEDGETRRMVEGGKTLGVFYVESPATRQLLRKMGTGDYPHLVIASSIIRPAANRSIEEYLRRLKGGAWESAHPSIDHVLRETLGIMVYQEDVSRIAIETCRFTPEEADSLRKVLTRKDRVTRLAVYRERFFAGAREQGISESALEALWEQVLSFDGYSFCKAHSASYALVSYRLAWIKRYFPLEFFTAVINNGGGFYSRQVYLDEVRRMGFPILPPDIARSSMEYTVEDGGLRVGLSQLADAAAPVLEAILAEREGGGAFRNLADLLGRVRIPAADFRVLVRSGALDSVAFPLTRPQIFWAAFHADRHPDLFGVPPVPPCIKDYPLAVKSRDEIATIGLAVSRHPLAWFSGRIADAARAMGTRWITTRSLAAHLGRNIVIPGMLVTGKEVPTRQKRSMSFLSFEDPWGIFETVAFPDVYERLFPVLDDTLFFMVQGRVTEEHGVIQVVVRDLRPLAGPARYSAPKPYVEAPAR